MVNNSPWPLINSFNLMNLLSNFILTMKTANKMSFMIFLFSMLLMIFSMMIWWRDTIRESTFQGYHSSSVTFGLKISMILFIMSEIMFFFSFFWAFFHFSLSPDMEISNNWPPIGINIFNPYHIPLLNSIILLSSGVTITWSHHLLFTKKFDILKNTLILTITLGVVFSILQSLEYKKALFSLNDSSFGTIFFMSTGFHGFHVLIGTSFIMITTLRVMNSQINNKHHFGFEAAAWYWHFVDVVWIYLFTFIYWWYW